MRCYVDSVEYRHTLSSDCYSLRHGTCKRQKILKRTGKLCGCICHGENNDNT